MVSASIHKNNFILGENFLKFLIGFSIIDCVFQISLGGFVRVTGSGLGCPDWPLCYGKIIPPMNYHTLIEWGHRSSGALLGLLILLINIVVVGYAISALWCSMISATCSRTSCLILRNSSQSLVFVKAYMKKSHEEAEKLLK